MLWYQGEDSRTVSTSESVASTLTAHSDDEPSTDEEDNADDTEDDSGTDTAASACSPAPIGARLESAGLQGED